MERFPTALVALYLLSATVGVAASLGGRRRLLFVMKPLTTALLFAVVGPPQSLFMWLIDLGILFSLGGDVALLLPIKGGGAFLLGLAIFLGAHVSYIAAFMVACLGAAGPSVVAPPVFACAAIMAVVSTLLLRRLWPGAAGIRAPLVIYAMALSAMVVAAVAAACANGAVTVPPIVAIGAVLFYVGDAALAVDQFHRRIPLAPLLTLGVYWLGQLSIALATRFATG
jgi:uncharacterized membrane protein YhhN